MCQKRCPYVTRCRLNLPYSERLTELGNDDRNDKRSSFEGPDGNDQRRKEPPEPSREPLGSLGQFIASSTYAQAAPFGYPLARLRSALDGLDATQLLLRALSGSLASGSAGLRRPRLFTSVGPHTFPKVASGDLPNAVGCAYNIGKRILPKGKKDVKEDLPLF